LCVAQSKNIWHANGNWEDDTKGAALYSLQTFTMGLGKSGLEHARPEKEQRPENAAP